MMEEENDLYFMQHGIIFQAAASFVTKPLAARLQLASNIEDSGELDKHVLPVNVFRDRIVELLNPL